MRCWIVPLVAVVAWTSARLGQIEPGWTQLSLSTCGVDRFLAAHPESDGRGVVIAVLDTGVDPSIPGLTRTPDGEVKVIDLQDFTGDGDVELEWIRLDPQSGKLVKHDEDGSPIEYQPPDLPAAPAGEERRCWLGAFKEAKFVNADQTDLNGNGKTDDEFPVLVTAFTGDGDDQAVCYVDTNLDRSFADEKPLRNYKLNYDSFVFPRQKPETEIQPMTFAVNIFLRPAKVVFQFDNGAHGTHVAGIAAGYRINNQDGFNGVAPGAKVVGLKIGCGGLGGISVTESMKKALEYAVRLARERDLPVVCNLSFGVDSEIEGSSDIDELLDEVLRKNPYLVFCTSAGNAGPGLSTVGTPAASTEAITVAAMMAADTGRDVAGWSMEDAAITPFSSRGGELDKPDLATPGWATSTVPRWVRGGDFWAGTSMASPYAAGLCAALISHAHTGGQAASATRREDQDHLAPGLAAGVQIRPTWRVRACDVRRALCLSARPVPGASVLDMGYGVPDLPKAAELLDTILAAAADDPVIGYKISTPCPHGHKGRARAAYWRSTYFPQQERQTFTISPVFAPTVDASARTSFVRKFTLRSKASWCRVPQETIYLRSEQDARAFVEYDAGQLVEPGLYIGTVEALGDGLAAFRLINTIIIPYRFAAQDDFKRSFKGRTVQGWKPDRYFCAIPPGASMLKLVLSAPEGQTSKAGFDDIFDPNGRPFRNGKRLNTETGQREVEWTMAEDLTPGVWEVPVLSDRPDKSWPYDLTVQFLGLHADPARITEGSASKPSGELTVTNLFEKPVAGTTDGQIEGFRLHKQDKFKGLKDELSYSVSLDDRFNRLRLRLEMTPEDYATTTDIAVLVKDSSGEAVHKGAFDDRIYEATFSTEGNKSLEVVIHGGFAVADDKRETPITVQIDTLFASPVTVKVERDGESSIDFVPGVPVKLEFSTAEKLKDIPDAQRPVGFLRVRERASNDTVLRVPLDIGS